MSGDFDEGQHPRAPDGKFGGGGGGAAGEKKPRSEKAAAAVSKGKALVEQRKAAAPAQARGVAKPTDEQNAKRVEDLKSGFMPWVTPAEREAHVAKEHADIKNEGEMLEAGHVKPVPTEKLEAYRSARDGVVKRVETITNNLDAAHHEAMKAVGKLDALSEDDGHHELRNPIDHDELSAAFSRSSNALHEVFGKESKEDFGAHRESHSGIEPIGGHPGKDDVEEYDSPEDHARAVTEHEAALAERKAQHLEAANHAQVALERLQGEQAKAQDALKKVDADHGKAFKQMLSEARSHEEDGVSDEVAALVDHHNDRGTEPPEHVGRAQDAARSLSAHEQGKRPSESPFEGGENGDGGGDLVDARGSIRSAMRETSKAIKQLAKVTGRAPKTVAAPKPAVDDVVVDEED